MQQLQIPPLHEGEIYVGAVGDQLGNLHHTILLPGDNDDASWQKQMDWAKSIGGDLPTRIEQALLYANLKRHFQPRAYWSAEKHQDDPSYAWCQSFDNGNQYYHLHASVELRARAVRRLPI